MRAFLSDRLNAAWLAAALVLVAALLLVPNDGAGTFVLIVVAAAAIGLSAAVRIRDGRRDRELGRSGLPGLGRGRERRPPPGDGS